MRSSCSSSSSTSSASEEEEEEEEVIEEVIEEEEENRKNAQAHSFTSPSHQQQCSSSFSYRDFPLHCERKRKGSIPSVPVLSSSFTPSSHTPSCINPFIHIIASSYAKPSEGSSEQERSSRKPGEEKPGEEKPKREKPEQVECMHPTKQSDGRKPRQGSGMGEKRGLDRLVDKKTNPSTSRRQKNSKCTQQQQRKHNNSIKGSTMTHPHPHHQCQGQGQEEEKEAREEAVEEDEEGEEEDNNPDNDNDDEEKGKAEATAEAAKTKVAFQQPPPKKSTRHLLSEQVARTVPNPNNAPSRKDLKKTMERLGKKVPELYNRFQLVDGELAQVLSLANIVAEKHYASLAQMASTIEGLLQTSSSSSTKEKEKPQQEKDHLQHAASLSSSSSLSLLEGTSSSSSSSYSAANTATGQQPSFSSSSFSTTSSQSTLQEALADLRMTKQKNMELRNQIAAMRTFRDRCMQMKDKCSDANHVLHEMCKKLLAHLSSKAPASLRRDAEDLLSASEKGRVMSSLDYSDKEACLKAVFESKDMMLLLQDNQLLFDRLQELETRRSRLDSVNVGVSSGVSGGSGLGASGDGGGGGGGRESRESGKKRGGGNDERKKRKAAEMMMSS
jgi:hypothetical protein